jgi:hypothetical protein
MAHQFVNCIALFTSDRGNPNRRSLAARAGDRARPQTADMAGGRSNPARSAGSKGFFAVAAGTFTRTNRFLKLAWPWVSREHARQPLARPPDPNSNDTTDEDYCVLQLPMK